MADDISNRTRPADGSTAPLPISHMPASASPVAASAIEAARERTIRVLTDRFADDTLSIDQFEALLDRMYKASTVAERPWSRITRSSLLPSRPRTVATRKRVQPW